MVLIWTIFSLLLTSLFSLRLHSRSKCAFANIYWSSVDDVNKVENKISIEKIPFDAIETYLAEHLQKTDQMLVLGARNDLFIRLAKQGYGRKKTGYLLVVDESQEYMQTCLRIVSKDGELQQMVKNKQLQFQHVSTLQELQKICKQSVFDSILDNQALDRLLQQEQGQKIMLQSVEHLQNSLRVGNVFVGLSKISKDIYCSAFQQFG
jgi:hypothetical protein